MDGLTLLARAHDAGLIVRLDRDRLVVRGPKRAAPVARLLLDNKAVVAAALVDADCRDGWSDAEDECAAIVEYNVGVPREWAEGLARLDAARAPANVPMRCWRLFVNSCGRFLDDGWAAKATAFGWGPLDIFGCERHRPYARIDRAGLLWLVEDGRIVALTADAAVIETASGARLTYLRNPMQAGQVLAWKLAP